MESNKNKEEDILFKRDPVSWGVMVSTFIELKIMFQLKWGNQTLCHQQTQVLSIKMLTNMLNSVMVGCGRVVSLRIREVIISNLSDLE